MPDVVKVAQVVLEILVPGTPVAPAPDIFIVLYGWKLFKDEPCVDTMESVEIPSVEKAV